MADLRRWCRRLLRAWVRRRAPLGERVGTRVLANPHLRPVLNIAYERVWPLFATVVTRFFATSSISVPFIWRARLRSGVLVVPEEQRSWSNALLWRWPPNLPMRRFYEEYVDYKRRSVPGMRNLLLDVGANDGMHSCLFALAGWCCVAFEPQTSCIAQVKRISDLNQFDDIRAEQCVVGDQAATDIDFYVSPSTWFSSLDQTSVERFEPAHAIRVDMITLDSYCSERNVSPTCVKIDVEGGELLVLRGARGLLETTNPDLVIEVSADTEIRTAVWNLLVPFGYHVYILSGSRGRILRSVPSMGAFVTANPGAAHVDAVFTADLALRAELETVLSPRPSQSWLGAAAARTLSRQSK